MRLARGFVAIAAAALAGPLLSVPAAQAAGSYDCFAGDRTPGQNGYQISAQGCDGTGYADIVIKVLGGSAAGRHRCSTAFPWNGFLSATGCRPE